MKFTQQNHMVNQPLQLLIYLQRVVVGKDIKPEKKYVIKVYGNESSTPRLITDNRSPQPLWAREDELRLIKETFKDVNLSLIKSIKLAYVCGLLSPTNDNSHSIVHTGDYYEVYIMCELV